MESKTIIRVQKNMDYTVINNTSINDKRLSWKAKAIHVFMLSKPDDWTFYNEELQQWAKDGKTSFDSGLSELKRFGYIKKERRRATGGKFEWVTVVYEVPQIATEQDVKPSVEKPCMENRCMDEQSQLNQGFEQPFNNSPYPEKPLMENPSMEKPLMENQQLLSTDALSTESLSTNTLITEKGEESNPPSPSSNPFVSQDLLKIKSHFETRVHFSEATYEQVKALDDFLEDYKDADLIIKAMEIAVERAKPHLQYINGILKVWRTDGVTNCQQLKAIEAQKANQRRPYKQGREEQLPDWFGKHQEQQLAYTQQQSVPEQQPVVDFEAEREKILAKLS